MANSQDCTEELFFLSCCSELSVGFYSGCVVNGVKFLTSNRDSRRVTQSSGISVPGSDDGSLPNYFGILEEVLEFTYVK